MFDNWRKKLQSHGERRKDAQQKLRLQRERLRQPIDDCRFVVLDTETTGFHAYGGDEIVSIAMLELRGLEPTGRIFNQLINPMRGIPAESTAVHGIRDSDVVGAPSIDRVIEHVWEFIADDVIVGHHTAFDIRFLNRAALGAFEQKITNPVLDTMLLYLGVSGRLGHYTLEEVASHCGVEIHNRHTALGDAEATCEIFRYLSRQMLGPEEPVSSLIARQGDTEL